MASLHEVLGLTYRGENFRVPPLIYAKGGVHMGEWYGGEHRVEAEKGLILKEIKLNFNSQSYSAYHNDVEVRHHLDAEIKVQAIDYYPAEIKPFGKDRRLSGVTSYQFGIKVLPPELQEKLKSVWLEVEQAMIGAYVDEEADNSTKLP
jgi:hypothetical protein